MPDADLLEKAIEAAEKYRKQAPKRRGHPFKVIELGLEEPVTRMFLQGWKMDRIVENLRARYGVDISAQALFRFRRKFIDPIKEIPQEIKERIAELSEGIDVVDELYRVYGVLKEREAEARRLERLTGFPSDVGNKIAEQQMRVLELIDKIRGRELGLPSQIVAGMSVKKSNGESYDVTIWDPGNVERYIRALERATGKRFTSEGPQEGVGGDESKVS